MIHSYRVFTFFLDSIVVDPEPNPGILSVRQQCILFGTPVHNRPPCTHTFTFMGNLAQPNHLLSEDPGDNDPLAHRTTSYFRISPQKAIFFSHHQVTAWQIVIDYYGISDVYSVIELLMNFVPQTNRFGLWGSTMILFELAFFFLWLCDSGFPPTSKQHAGQWIKYHTFLRYVNA